MLGSSTDEFNEFQQLRNQLEWEATKPHALGDRKGAVFQLESGNWN